MKLATKSQNMRKITIIALLALITSSSCNRDYLCTCTMEGTAISNEEIYNSSKSDAQNECDMKKSPIQGQIWDCKLY